MTKNNLAIVVLAAGKGTRMKSKTSKVLHKIAGLEMIGHVLNACHKMNAERVVVVTSPDMPEVADYAAKFAKDVKIAIQDKQLGTGHAVMCAEQALSDFSGTVITLCGDTPLIDAEEIKALATKVTDSAKISILAMDSNPANSYGRLITANGFVERIVEVKDAFPHELEIRLANSGIIAANSKLLFECLKMLGNNNSQNEYYLTDIVAIANSKGEKVTYSIGNEENLQGINSREQLSIAELAWQQRKRKEVMAGGCTLIDPDSVFFNYDTSIGKDVVIQPNVFFGSNVQIADNVLIKAFCHIEGAKIEDGATIGPFARLRVGSVIEESVHIGNFVETKNTVMKKGSKANHLSYIGDSEVGEKANIGAGTITCNYDGYGKYKTVIGEGAFIGSNSSLVAPVSIGKGAITGAGSVVTSDIPDDSLVLTRADQTIKSEWAKEFRIKKSKEKNESNT